MKRIEKWETLAWLYLLLVILIVFVLSVIKVERVTQERFGTEIRMTESMSIPRGGPIKED